MKKLLPIILIVCLMLCSCGGKTEEATTAAGVDETTTAAEAVALVNPLNGEKLDAEFSGRIFAVTINNVSAALPFKGVSQADVFFEMFINDYCTRGLALYTDIKSVPDIGSVRSNRLNFTDIAKAYNSVLIHAGGSDLVMNDLAQSGVDQFHAENSTAGYRDSDRSAAGYAFEHTLFIKGEAAYNFAAAKGYELNATGKSYGLVFADEGTPDGQAADTVDITFTLYGRTKSTTMKYDAAVDAYSFNQYGEKMTDCGADVYFKNVLVILAPTENLDVYHVADLIGSGDAYFACGGKAVQCQWTRAAETDAFTFTMADGSPVKLEAGNSYIAIAPTGSPINIF